MEQIGRYRILGEIGRGGMATVYRGFDPNVDREVAIKVLPQQFLHDTSFRERFMREAKVIARLEHSAIVPIYDFGEEEGQPYLVMRYLTGGTLADRIQKGALPLHETSAIVTRIATALEEAHERAIVHRDLKPGNILFDPNGAAFLSDFGIVKLAEASAALTGTGVVGTPTYMSPEQAYGDSDIDGRADIYSLGIIIYEMLTGRAPYEADTPMGIAMKHILEPVPQILEARPDLPKSVGMLLDRALAKDRKHRFTTATELAEKLAEIADGQEPEIEPVPETTSSVAPLPDPRTMRIDTAAPAPATEALIQETPPPPSPGTPPPPAAPAQPMSKREKRRARRDERKKNRRGVPIGIVIAMTLVGLTLMVCIAVVAFGQGVNVAVQNVLGLNNNAVSGERTQIDIGQPLNGAEALEARITIDSARTSIYGEEIDFAASGSYEAPVEFDELEVTYDVTEAAGALTITQPTSEFNIGNLRPGVIPELDLGLNNTLPLELYVNAGVGSLTLDMSTLKVMVVEVTGGAGLLDIEMPQQGEVSLSVEAPLGDLTLNAPEEAADLTIVGFEVATGAAGSLIQLPIASSGYEVTLDMGLGSTIVEVPAGMPIRIKMTTTDMASLTNNVETISMVGATTWESDGFDPEDPMAVFVEVRASVGELIINER